MWPFFAFYGGKWRAAPRYPEPAYDVIIEPFAGAAGYATRNHDRQVILVEKDPRIAALWQYLIDATDEEIQSLPLMPMDGSSVDDLGLSGPETDLIGFWLNKGAAAPCKRPSAWMREGLRPNSFWGPQIRDRIAAQVMKIKHWRVVHGDYWQAPDVVATWFIDPPYKGAGVHYKESAKALDFLHLSAWCQTRLGQAIVCENDGATWLPFEPFITIKANEGGNGGKRSKESIWLGENA